MKKKGHHGRYPERDAADGASVVGTIGRYSDAEMRTK